MNVAVRTHTVFEQVGTSGMERSFAQEVEKLKLGAGDVFHGEVTIAVAADYELACNTADLAIWARGYGDVRHRGLARLAQIFTNWSRRIAADREGLSDTVRASLAAAYSDPDAEVTQ